ncbi:hypothetical protein C8Q79DRAFT_471392 [Trametes meyenii]|nr:hypothetical protein C8Q79DRAFT_471392 [Trametes meyenii]
MEQLSSAPLQSAPMMLPMFPPLDDTVGAWFIATFVGVTLYGITLQQAFRYYRLYPSDSTNLKGLVVVLLVFETFHTLLCAHVCYVYLNTKLFNPLAVGTSSGPWALQTLPLAAGAVIFVAHGFFARRIYLFGSRYRALLAIAIVLIFGELGFSAAASAKAYELTNITDFAKAIWLISTATAMTAVTDVFLSGVLIVSLHQSRTGYKTTDSLINTLMLYAIGTGLVTSISVLFSFIFSVAHPSKEIYAAFSMGGTKLYANTVFVALNSRKALGERNAQTTAEAWPFSWNVAVPSSTSAGTIELRPVRRPGATTTGSDSQSVFNIKAHGGPAGLSTDTAELDGMTGTESGF